MDSLKGTLSPGVCRVTAVALETLARRRCPHACIDLVV